MRNRPGRPWQKSRAFLALPGVNKLSYNKDERRIIAEHKPEDGVEIVSAPLPFYAVVLPDINSLRILTLKQVFVAAKKPVKMSRHRAMAASRAHDATTDVVAATMEWLGSNFRPTPM